jgi:hypothetical protein
LVFAALLGQICFIVRLALINLLFSYLMGTFFRRLYKLLFRYKKLLVRINISRFHGSDLTTGGTEMGRLLRITKRITAFALCAVILLSSVHVFAESGVFVSIFDRGTAAWSENELPVRDPVETVTKKIRFDLLAGNGTMDVSTSGRTYTITAVPNAGCTFAGHYKQNALTTLVTTQSVLQIPMDQSTNLYRHPLFEG